MVVQFCYHKYDYRHNGTPLSLITSTYQTSCLCYQPQPLPSADSVHIVNGFIDTSTCNQDLSFGNSCYHVQPHPIITKHFQYHESKPYMLSEKKNTKKSNLHTCTNKLTNEL